MSSTGLLMPKATAVWLVESSSLTFEQIGAFCTLHPLEVKAIADGEAAVGIKGLDPVQAGQLTREELDRAEKNPKHELKLARPKTSVPDMAPRKGARYTPLSRRQDRPNAILWLLRNHGELKDAQIIRLVGTTKTTIDAIRERSHWNAATLQPMDPVTLSLCSQMDLDFEVAKSAKDRPAPAPDMGATLLPAEATTAPPASQQPFADMTAPKRVVEERIDANSVFGKLKQLKPEEQAGED